jgi:hypothetical protein
MNFMDLFDLFTRGVVALEKLADQSERNADTAEAMLKHIQGVTIGAEHASAAPVLVDPVEKAVVVGDGKTVAGQAVEAQQAAMAAVERSRKEAVEQAKPAAQAETKATKPPTVDDVRKALGAYAKVHGNPAAMAVLQKHEAASVSALHEDKRQALIDDCKL